jgi:hypothetical protein
LRKVCWSHFCASKGKDGGHRGRDAGISAGAVQVWFHGLYPELELSGVSSHSGRRTFITRVAKKIVEAGGLLAEVLSEP